MEDPKTTAIKGRLNPSWSVSGDFRAPSFGGSRADVASYGSEDDLVVFRGRSTHQSPGRRIELVPVLAPVVCKDPPVGPLESSPSERSDDRHLGDCSLVKKVRFCPVVQVRELPPAVERKVQVTKSAAEKARKRSERRAAIRAGTVKRPRNFLSSLREESRLVEGLERLLLEEESDGGECASSSDSLDSVSVTPRKFSRSQTGPFRGTHLHWQQDFTQGSSPVGSKMTGVDFSTEPTVGLRRPDPTNLNSARTRVSRKRGVSAPRGLQVANHVQESCADMVGSGF
jgi:hypothetical protein